MAKIELKIEGMSCAHCVMHVQQALKKIKGVKSAAVSLASESAVIEHESADLDAMKDAVDEAGYRVSGTREV